MLIPLTDLVGACRETKPTKKNKTKKLPWRWDPIHQQAFDKGKATIAKDVVLAYPDFTKPFEIYMDASTMQLGAMITQDNRPIAFSSRKISKMHQNQTPSHSRNIKGISRYMLWGQTIKVYTDHKNLI